MKNYNDEYIGIETMLPDDIVDLLNIQTAILDDEPFDTELQLDEYELAMFTYA